MQLITIAEAAAILGRDPSTISRAISAGRLSFAPGTRKLEREGIEQRYAARTRPRIDRPLSRGPQISHEGVEWWDACAAKLNGYLDPAYGLWPHLTGAQLAVYVGCLEMAAEELV